MTWTRIVILASVPVLGALIVLKSDKQIVHILQGYLFKNHKNTAQAKPAYKKHLSPYSFAAIVTGFALGAVGLVLIALGQEEVLSWALFVIGVVLTLFGSWQRLRAFQLAARDLKSCQPRHGRRFKRDRAILSA